MQLLEYTYSMMSMFLMKLKYIWFILEGIMWYIC